MLRPFETITLLGFTYLRSKLMAKGPEPEDMWQSTFDSNFSLAKCQLNNTYLLCLVILQRRSQSAWDTYVTGKVHISAYHVQLITRKLFRVSNLQAPRKISFKSSMQRVTIEQLMDLIGTTPFSLKGKAFKIFEQF